MAKMQRLTLFLAVLSGVVVLVSLATLEAPALAQGPTVRYVAPGGDCGGQSPCYATIQGAADSATNGDTIKVAQGTYTSTDFQVLYINRAITVSGGYSPLNWTATYPVTQPTVLDAESADRRRGVYIDGTGVPTITLTGLTVQRGYWPLGTGGAINIVTGTVVIHASQVLSSVVGGTTGASSGGGIYLANGQLVLSDSTIRGNTADLMGGGVHIESGSAYLNANLFQENSAYRGGGLCGRYLANMYAVGNTFDGNRAYYAGGLNAHSGVPYGLPNNETVLDGNTFTGNFGRYGAGGAQVEAGAVVKGNIFDENETYATGGGLMAGGSGPHTIVQGNVFKNNRAETGGALYLVTAVDMRDNLVFSNTATVAAGGIAIVGGVIDAQNDVIADNIAPFEGVYMSNGSLAVRHWTLVNNGQYGFFRNSGTASFTNTIVASHTVAGLWGAGVTSDHALLFGNGTACAGGATCIGGLTGDPKFVDPPAGDFHIGPASAAIDAGVTANVTTDMDGDPRPLCSGYDIGADEFMPPAPAAAFSSSAPVWLGNSVIFTNTTVFTGCASYLWVYGDGSTSTATSPTHAYSAPGIYTAVLTATNDGGSSVATDTVTIYGAAFASSSPDWLDQSTAFTNTTYTSGTTAFLWAFGDGITSTQESPTHTYASPGIYPVGLTAINAAGTGVATASIVVFGPPAAGFTGQPLSGVRPLTVTFMSTTTTVPQPDETLVYSWNFGDGAASATASPAHTYHLSGVYTVTLNAANAAGEDTVTRTACIAVLPIPVHAGFNAAPTTGVVPLMVTFTNTASGDYDTGLWEFGDGVTSSLVNPTHTYVAASTYTVTLTVSNVAGYSSVTVPSLVHVQHGVYLPSVVRAP